MGTYLDQAVCLRTDLDSRVVFYQFTKWRHCYSVMELLISVRTAPVCSYTTEFQLTRSNVLYHFLLGFFFRIPDEWIELPPTSEQPSFQLSKQVKVCNLNADSKCRLERHLYGSPPTDSSTADDRHQRKPKSSRKRPQVHVPSIWTPPPPKGLFWKMIVKTKPHRFYLWGKSLVVPISQNYPICI